MAGNSGGVLWVQDASLEGKTAQEIRADTTMRSGVQLEISGLTSGTYTITPYDTWQGVWLDAFIVECGEGSCPIELPEFWHDMAFKLERE
jgi:hypothetical protein